MATQRVASAASKLSSAVPLTKQVGDRVVSAAASESWIKSMPTRAIADALLSKENCLYPHDKLYEEVDETGLFRSHRHFKHCLRMLRQQKRVKIMCLGPEKVGSSKRKFTVKLTQKGQTTYKFYKNRFNRIQVERPDDQKPGLTDALP